MPAHSKSSGMRPCIKAPNQLAIAIDAVDEEPERVRKRIVTSTGGFANVCLLPVLVPSKEERLMQGPGKAKETTAGSGTLQTPDIEGDLWSLLDILDGTGWPPAEASTDTDPGMQLLPWIAPLEASTAPSAMDHTPGVAALSKPACQPNAVINDNITGEQAPAAATSPACHVEPCRPSTPPAQPRPLQAASAHDQALAASAALAAPTAASGPPSWAEAGFLGGAQQAAANWGVLEVPPPAQPPAQPQPALPIAQPAPVKTLKPRIDSTQRKKAEAAAMGNSVDLLLDRKAALERELVDLLNRHEELSTNLPWHMQHEEVSFMASIASCMAPAAARQPPRTQPVLEPSPQLLQNLMLEPSATINELYRSSGLFSTKPLKENAVPSPAVHGIPEQNGKGAVLWSSILAFLRLSKAQKDSLAAIYSAHLVYVDALRSECLGVASKLQLLPQSAGLLKPNMASHLVCGQLTGVAVQVEHLMQCLTDACCRVLSNVQLNNMHALAPAGASSFVALCKEATASLKSQLARAASTKSSTSAAKSKAPPSKRRQTRKSATGAVHGAVQSTANIAPADAPGPADITADIIRAAIVPAGGAAAVQGKVPARPVQSQPGGCPAQAADAAVTIYLAGVPQKQGKRKAPDSS